jgi:adenylate cyclase class 2
MSLEIEQKYRVTSHELISDRLRASGAEVGERIDQEDTYLRHPSRDFKQTNEAFRIRRVGARNFITYKGPKHPGPTKTREELEIPFEDGAHSAEQMLRLFRALGFEPLAIIRKARTPYHLTISSRAFEVVLDDAEGIGKFVEVETIVDDLGDLAKAQAAVVETARSLGLVDLEPRSYLRMALEREA